MIDHKQLRNKEDPRKLQFPPKCPYEKGKKLGQGAFGKVYVVRHLCYDQQNNQIVKRYARKIVPYRQNTKEMIMEEMQLMMSLKHPNVIGCYDIIDDENELELSIVMDLCDRDLESIIKKERSPEQLQKIVKDIVLGVMYLHQKKIIHRDLKPANILIQQGIVKITDLGTAKVMKTKGNTNTKSGTQWYRAPETAIEDRYTQAVDIWALGLIFMELATNEPLMDLLQGHDPPYRRNNFPSKKLLQRITNQKIKALITQMMKVQPNQRPTIQQVWGMLQQQEPIIKKHQNKDYLAEANKSYQNKDYQNALNCYKEAIIRNPKSQAAYNGLGLTHRRMKKYQQAISCCQKAIEINPNYSKAHNELGNVYDNLGKREQAIKCYQTAIQINPNHSKAHYNLGNVYDDLGKHEQAIKCYQTAIRINPNNSKAHYNLGNVYDSLGKREQAIKCYQTAIQINPNNSDAHNNLGNVYDNLGKREQAIKCYQTAIQINPNDPSTHYNLGRVYAKMNKFNDALQSYKNALAKAPNNNKYQNKVDDMIKQLNRKK